MRRVFGDRRGLRNYRVSSWLKGVRGGSSEEVCPGQAFPEVRIGGTRSTGPPKLALKVITERKIPFRVEY